MPTINDVLAIEGAGELVPALGKEWHVTPPTPQTKAAFEASMVLDARQKLLARKDIIPAAQFRKEWRMQTAAELREDFAWGGEMFFDVIPSNKMGARLTLLILRQRQPDVTAEIVTEIYKEAHELLTWAIQSTLHKAEPTLFSAPGKKPGTQAGESETAGKGAASDTAATPSAS